MFGGFLGTAWSFCDFSDLSAFSFGRSLSSSGSGARAPSPGMVLHRNALRRGDFIAVLSDQHSVSSLLVPLPPSRGFWQRRPLLQHSGAAQAGAWIRSPDRTALNSSSKVCCARSCQSSGCLETKRWTQGLKCASRDIIIQRMEDGCSLPRTSQAATADFRRTVELSGTVVMKRSLSKSRCVSCHPRTIRANMIYNLHIQRRPALLDFRAPFEWHHFAGTCHRGWFANLRHLRL